MISTAHDSPRDTDIQAHLESLPLFSELSGPEIELLVPLCRVLMDQWATIFWKKG